MSGAHFFGKFLRNPTQIGALCPSSSHLCRAMTDSIGLHQARYIVELGAGTGVITHEILRAMSQDARLITVELDPALCSVLRGQLPSQVQIINDSAANLPLILSGSNLPHADVVLSGLPWAAFPTSLQKEILQSVLSVLAPGGYFATFAYLSGLPLPAGRRFRKMLEKHFSSVELSPVIWRNLPPAVIYRCHT